MELPTETMFGILKFLSPQDICVFGRVHPSFREIANDQEFWKFYSLERNNPKNKYKICHKTWAFQMHKKIQATIFRMGVFSDLCKTVETQNSISCLTNVLVPVAKFPRHKFFIHDKDGRIMEGYERVPKELVRHTKYGPDDHVLAEFHLFAQ
ncbi:hypothetical protein LAU_0142 [Lausannevirus]|uniref:F-box domain-containing protein n=1 Tax=Lausannevirus TaxID=999883 RepID=F2WL70_9VIRU|nr:hypothetical protein LAU_0142 [Lausannevirus]AEA06993.1 hypothetical protein LAU_0142 [Lausannevirus]